MSRIRIDFRNGDVFDESHIFHEPVYTQKINAGGDMLVGTAATAQFKFNLNAMYEDLPALQGREFTVTMDGAQIGVFTAERPVKVSENIVAVTAYDRMRQFDVILDEWVKIGHSYPVSLTGFFQALCARCGVAIAPESFSMVYNYDIPEPPFVNNTTGLQLLRYICEISACFAMINPQGELVLRWYDDKSDAFGDDDDDGDDDVPGAGTGGAISIRRNAVFSLDEADYQDETDKIERVRVSSASLSVMHPAGSSDRNVYIVQDNPLIISREAPFNRNMDNEAILDGIARNIFNRLRDISYVPFKLEAPRGDLAIGAGDIIRVFPRKGRNSQNGFKAYIMNYEATGITAYKFRASATGSRTRETPPNEALRGIAQNIDYIIECAKDEILAPDTMAMMNAWRRYMMVEYLETNFEALDLNTDAAVLDMELNNDGYYERNFIRIHGQNILFIRAELDPDETNCEYYKTPGLSGRDNPRSQVYWTAVGDHPQAYRFFTVTDPATLPAARYFTPDEQEDLREKFRVRVRKTVREQILHSQEFDESHGEKIPKHIWGYGAGGDDGRGKGYVYKDSDGLYFTYKLREATHGLPAGTEVGLRVVEGREHNGAQFFDMRDGQWKNITASGRNIHCRHFNTVANALVLHVEDECLSVLPPNGAYHFTLRTATPLNPSIEIWARPNPNPASDFVRLTAQSHPWRRGNGTPVEPGDYIIGARIEIRHNFPTDGVIGGIGSSSFFSDAPAGGGNPSCNCVLHCTCNRAPVTGEGNDKFQFAVGKTVRRRRFQFTYSGAYEFGARR